MKVDKRNNFFCIGAQKAGTTTLHDILAKNPNIILPKNKETHFFSHDDLYSEDIEDYYDMFQSDFETNKIIGEVDPEYLHSSEASARILRHFGENLKFIVILRNPADRAYSQYLMSARRGFEKLSFQEALKLEEERIKDDFGKLYFSYQSRGLYCSQLKGFFKLFNPENFLIIRFEEDFLKDKQQMLSRINNFLGLTDFNYDIQIDSNKASVSKNKVLRDFVNKPNLVRKIGKKLIPSPYLRRDIIAKIDSLNRKNIASSLDDTIRKRLIEDKFMPDILELEELVNVDLSSWYK